MSNSVLVEREQMTANLFELERDVDTMTKFAYRLWQAAIDRSAFSPQEVEALSTVYCCCAGFAGDLYAVVTLTVKKLEQEVSK